MNERLYQRYCLLNEITVMVKKEYLTSEVFPLLTIIEMQILGVASHSKENLYMGVPLLQ